MKTFSEKLECADGVGGIFELVKEAAWKTRGIGRAGLSLGLIELGSSEHAWIGGFHQLGSNLIVMNKAPIRSIGHTNPELFKPYMFHVLLHEYIHALGYADEGLTRRTVDEITEELFGPEHVTTKMSKNMASFIPELSHAPEGFEPAENAPIELVRDFDRSCTEYIM
jgi:hypothetical protein